MFKHTPGMAILFLNGDWSSSGLAYAGVPLS